MADKSTKDQLNKQVCSAMAALMPGQEVRVQLRF